MKHWLIFLCALGLCSLPAQSQQKETIPAEGNQATNQQDPPDSRDRVLYAEETEHIKPLTRKLASNILMDQKDIWTSPLRIRGKDKIPWILVGVGTGVLIATDHWTSRQLPNTVDQVAISKDVSQLGAGYTVLPITAGFYIGGALAHNEKARETGILAAEAILDSAIVGEVFKVAFRRERPLDGNGNGAFFQGGSSFPSGHSAVSWALASVVAHEYNANIWYPMAAYGLASVVSLSRLSGRQHFASDVVAGGAMGWFVGRYVFKTHVDHSIHRRTSSKLSLPQPRLMPIFGGDTRGVVLTWEASR